MRTTLDLPDDLMRLIKVRAALEGKKLKEVMVEAVRKGLASDGIDHYGRAREASSLYYQSMPKEMNPDCKDLDAVRAKRLEQIQPLMFRTDGAVKSLTGSELDELEVQEHLEKHERPS